MFLDFGFGLAFQIFASLRGGGSELHSLVCVLFGRADRFCRHFPFVFLFSLLSRRFRHGTILLVYLTRYDFAHLEWPLTVSDLIRNFGKSKRVLSVNVNGVFSHWLPMSSIQLLRVAENVWKSKSSAIASTVIERYGI